MDVPGRRGGGAAIKQITMAGDNAADHLTMPTGKKLPSDRRGYGMNQTKYVSTYSLGHLLARLLDMSVSPKREYNPEITYAPLPLSLIPI